MTSNVFPNEFSNYFSNEFSNEFSNDFHNGTSWTEGWIWDLQFWVLSMKNLFFARVILLDNSIYWWVAKCYKTLSLDKRKLSCDSSEIVDNTK